MQLPIIVAPMAGGPSTVDLAAAVSLAGGYGFLAAGNKSAGAMAEEIEQLRARVHTFGVNLFAPPSQSVNVDEFQVYAQRLQPEAEIHGVVLDPLPKSGDDEWSEKLEYLRANPVEVVSVTFGLPERAEISMLQAAGSFVVATVTSPVEAQNAAELGVDGLVVQGYRAGGHSAVHDPRTWPAELETAELVRAVRQSVHLPVIAAGGIDGPAAVREMLDAGAEGVSVGTMFLRTDEAGTSPTHRAAIGDPEFTSTTLTRAFTGRPARGLHNGFIDRHHSAAPAGYPEVHYLTRELSAAAGAAADTDRLH
ncbi:MAG: nitronate monooxygenase, partial [Leucobacter sp.]|nr:nitronate monooxygenase [Leucobacter sp.]